MKTIVAETVFLGKEAFQTIGDVVVVPDRQIRREHLRDAAALVVRSKTAVTRDLVEGSPLQFVGTATAGFEHLDVAALDALGIAWAAAPGCNADSVADYITAALMTLRSPGGMDIEGQTLGIVGAGQVGSRVARRAEGLGMKVLLNDPPRAEREGAGAFASLDALLDAADIVTLHVPLTDAGPWPTRHLANKRFFDCIKPGASFINASRGKVLDNDALLTALANSTVRHAILDVWDPEPGLRADLLSAVLIGTPHIAGHSLEGKLNGTVQVYREACRVLDRGPCWDPAPLLPTPDIPELKIISRGRERFALLAEAVGLVYDIWEDHLRPEQISLFDSLRSGYRIRREFKNTHIELQPGDPALQHAFDQIGFTVHPSSSARGNTQDTCGTSSAYCPGETI